MLMMVTLVMLVLMIKAMAMVTDAGEGGDGRLVTVRELTTMERCC